MKCWRGQTPKQMGLHSSIMKHHNSIYGAPIQIMQFYMNYRAPSPFIELHEQLCIKIYLHRAPLCSSIGWLNISVFLSFFTESECNLSHQWIVIYCAWAELDCFWIY